MSATEFSLAGERFIVVTFDLSPPAPPASLSPAETEVFWSLLRGESNARIAASRGTRVRTIANQVASIFAKLGVHSRAELAAWAAAPSGR